MPAERSIKRFALLLALLAGSVSATAAAQTLTDELSKRSGLPPSEITSLLSTCDANQTSMKFCAWRDQLVAERALQRFIDEQRATSPKCAASLAQKVAAWQKQRDTTCRESAEKEWGNGSMLPAAVAMCETNSTKQMTQTLSAHVCR